MVQATLASMRHYCPNVPICLTVDGDFDVSDLEDDYKVIILRVGDLPSAEMRKLIAGGFHAKHALMWEGPFEFYVWIDSDAIVWGDFTSQIRTDVDFQIFWSEISIPADATTVFRSRGSQSPESWLVRVRPKHLQGRHGNAQLFDPHNGTERRSENNCVRLATHSDLSRHSRVRAGVRRHGLAVSRKDLKAACRALLRR